MGVDWRRRQHRDESRSNGSNGLLPELPWYVLTSRVGASASDARLLFRPRGVLHCAVGAQARRDIRQRLIGRLGGARAWIATIRKWSALLVVHQIQETPQALHLHTREHCTKLLSCVRGREEGALSVPNSSSSTNNCPRGSIIVGRELKAFQVGFNQVTYTTDASTRPLYQMEHEHPSDLASGGCRVESACMRAAIQEHDLVTPYSATFGAFDGAGPHPLAQATSSTTERHST